MRRRRPLKWHGKNRTLRAFVTARTRPIGPAERAKERENRSPDRGVRLEAGRGEAWRVEVRHGSRPHGDASSVRRRRRQARARRTPSGPGAGQHRASDDERRSRGARGAADIWQSHHAREPHHTQAKSPPAAPALRRAPEPDDRSRNDAVVCQLARRALAPDELGAFRADGSLRRQSVPLVAQPGSRR
jgi:hypothetical protein